MKRFHLFILLIMLLFAALQWNDNDGLIWMALYLIAALLAFIAYKEICLPCTLAWAAMVSLLTLYMLIAVSPSLIEVIKTNAFTEILLTMSNNKPYIEQTREALGLLIILFYCCSIFIYTYVKRTKHYS